MSKFEQIEPPQEEEKIALGLCPLCGRPMYEGKSVDRHHWLPKSRGGRDWSWLHRACHRKIHVVFSNKELDSEYHTAESLLAVEEIAKFVSWVKRKNPEWLGKHSKKLKKKKKR